MRALSIRRVAWFAALGLAATSAAVACANSDDTTDGPNEPFEGGVLVVDGAPPDASASADVDAAPPTCSDAGWCKTTLPDIQTQIGDIWPLDDRAFALVATEARGTKVMEWDGSSWSYIDDGTQNDIRNAPEGIWAPGDNEVYFVFADGSMVLGGTSAGHVVYHGTRTAPGAPWTWTHVELPCDHFDVGSAIWGASASDVWATGCGKIYRHQTDGGAADAGDSGAPGWTVAYADKGPPGELETNFIAGTGEDDVWFSAMRGNYCLALFHKSATSIGPLIDSTVAADGTCQKKGALPSVTGVLAGLSAPAANLVIGSLRITPPDGSNIGYGMMKMTALSDGGVSIAEDDPQLQFLLGLGETWASSPDETWILANQQVVLNAKNLWTDAGTYNFSTISLNGEPNIYPLNVIRGRSDHNLWLGGAGLAYHKTTP